MTTVDGPELSCTRSRGSLCLPWPLRASLRDPVADFGVSRAAVLFESGGSTAATAPGVALPVAFPASRIGFPLIIST